MNIIRQSNHYWWQKNVNEVDNYPFLFSIKDSFNPNTTHFTLLQDRQLCLLIRSTEPFFLDIIDLWEWTKEYSFTLYRLLIFKRLWPKNQRGKTPVSNTDRNNDQEKKIQILRITFACYVFNKHFHKMDLFSKLKQENVIIMDCCHAGVNEQNRNYAMDFTILYHHPL